MKLSVKTGEGSLPPAQTAGRSVKSTAQRGDGSEKQGFGVEIWLDKPSDGGTIAEANSKTQFDAMNNGLNGKSRSNAFSLVKLLVVIAIIALIAALVLPALLQAKQKADQIRCVDNLHQLGIGVQSFVTDHHAYPLGFR